MGTNYVVPQASPFLPNGVSSVVAGTNIGISPGTGAVTITDLAGTNYVSSINSVINAVQITSATVGSVITDVGGDTIVITQRVAGLEAGARVIVTPSAGNYTINFV
jgi:hypothetical protein